MTDNEGMPMLADNGNTNEAAGLRREAEKDFDEDIISQHA